MEKISLNVNGMSCSHCEKAVVNALKELGAASVSASAAGKKVDIEFDSARLTLPDIKKTIEQTGYTVV